MKTILYPALILCLLATLAACGGSHGSIPDSTPAVLAPGASYTMVANNSVLVPVGSTVTVNGSVITVTGSDNTTNTTVGAVVNVPITATGTANDTVTTE